MIRATPASIGIRVTAILNSPDHARAIPHANMDPNDINKATSYPFDTLGSFSSDLLDNLSLVGFRECHGFRKLDLFFPKLHTRKAKSLSVVIFERGARSGVEET